MLEDKKNSRYINRGYIGKKVVVLFITAIFCIGALIPAVNSLSIENKKRAGETSFTEIGANVNIELDSKNLINSILDNAHVLINNGDLNYNPNPAPLDIDNPLSGWSNRTRIVISHENIDQDLVNFSLLFDIHNDMGLATYAQDDFDDVLFTNDTVSWIDGNISDRLHHEIEVYNSTNGNITVWINVTSISSSEDTILFMYYGNSSSENMQFSRRADLHSAESPYALVEKEYGEDGASIRLGHFAIEVITWPHWSLPVMQTCRPIPLAMGRFPPDVQCLPYPRVSRFSLAATTTISIPTATTGSIRGTLRIMGRSGSVSQTTSSKG